MPRPKKWRKVCHMPCSAAFAPVGSAFAPDKAVIMTVDEYETIRLMDYEGFTQAACAGYMRIARTTVQQIYADARKKIAEALVDGKSLFIHGGEYHLCDGLEERCGCGGCPRHRCSFNEEQMERSKENDYCGTL